MGGGKTRIQMYTESSSCESIHNRSLTSFTNQNEIQTKLTDYISNEGIGNLRSMISVLDPSTSKLITVASFIYRNRKELHEAYIDLEETLDSSDSIDEKMLNTASILVNTSATIIKKEGMFSVIKLAANELSDAVVDTADNENIFDNIDKSLNMPKAGEHFKDILKDTIKKETEKSLSSLIGDKI